MRVDKQPPQTNAAKTHTHSECAWVVVLFGYRCRYLVGRCEPPKHATNRIAHRRRRCIAVCPDGCAEAPGALPECSAGPVVVAPPSRTMEGAHAWVSQYRSYACVSAGGDAPARQQLPVLSRTLRACLQELPLDVLMQHLVSR